MADFIQNLLRKKIQGSMVAPGPWNETYGERPSVNIVDPTAVIAKSNPFSSDALDSLERKMPIPLEDRPTSADSVREILATPAPRKADYPEGLGRKLGGVLAGIGYGFLRGPEAGIKLGDRVMNPHYTRATDERNRQLAEASNLMKFDQGQETFDLNRQKVQGDIAEGLARREAEKERATAEVARRGSYAPWQEEHELKKELADRATPSLQGQWQVTLQDGSKVIAMYDRKRGGMTNVKDGSLISPAAIKGEPVPYAGERSTDFNRFLEQYKVEHPGEQITTEQIQQLRGKWTDPTGLGAALRGAQIQTIGKDDTRGDKAQEFNMVKTFQNEFDNSPIVKSHHITSRYAETAQTALNSLMAAAKSGNTQNIQQQAMIYAANKIFDPPSVVREGEYARSIGGQAIANRIDGFIQRLASGGQGLSLSELQSINSLIQQLRANSERVVGEHRTLITERAKQSGVDPAKIFPSTTGGSETVKRTADDYRRMIKK